MNPEDYRSVAQLASITQISLRSLWRYLKRPNMHRYKKRFPGQARYRWHVHVIPRLREAHLRGTLQSGRKLPRKDPR